MPDRIVPGVGQSAAWAVMPAFFVLIWSTGFIAARYASPHAPPLQFLVLRYAGSLAVLLAVIVWTRAPWPQTRREWWGTAAVGVLLQAAYLGGVWVAIAAGMPAGVSALIVGTQPLFTAALAGTVGERTHARQWTGLLIGFAGVGLVLSDRIALAGVSMQALAANLLALGGITLGTLLQKRIGARVDIRTGSAVQFAASLVITLPLAWWYQGPPIDPAPAFWIALAWSILGLSVGAISLLLLLIRRGRATTVASLMYLTPVVTTLMAWQLFGQHLGVLAWCGIAVTMAGVALATFSPRRD